MTERLGLRPRLRRPSWRRLLPFVLLALLGVAVALPAAAPLQLGAPQSAAASAFGSALADVGQGERVLVDVEADLGTYPEIRYATRAALAELVARGASLAFVSFSPEGRAIEVAELARLRDARVPPHRLLDLGYVAGAEAGMVLSVTSIVPEGAAGSFATDLRSRGGGIGAFDLALVVAGTEMGPRSWIEQVETRLPELPVIAIAPTFLRPELEPYLRSGQLAALLGTFRDGVAYGTAADASRGPGELRSPEPAPSSLAILIGILVALAVLLEADANRVVAALRAAWQRVGG